MIFSRVSNEFSSRTLLLLFLEFVVLVLGFFISLQVNEWQNNRENRELELQYLLRLESDFENSSAALTNNIAKMESSLQKLEAGLSMLANDERDEDDYQRIFEALQSSSIMGSFEIFFGTYEELKDTGYMRLIESTALRESLIDVRQAYLQVSKFIPIRNLLRGNTFPVMARYVQPQAGNRLTFDSQLVEQDPRQLYVAMSIIRANLSYDLDDSEEVRTLVNLTLNIIRDEITLRS